MRNYVVALCAVALTAVPAGAVDTSRGQDGEARLAKLLEGRTAGEPVSCINFHQITSTDVIDRTAIIYRTGGTLYVNRPESGANTLDRDVILVTDTSLSQLCNVDVVRLVDQASRFPRGVVGLGKFVPYSRAVRDAK